MVQVSRTSSVYTRAVECLRALEIVQSFHMISGQLPVSEPARARTATPPVRRGTIGTASTPDGFWQEMVAGGDGLEIFNCAQRGQKWPDFGQNSDTNLKFNSSRPPRPRAEAAIATVVSGGVVPVVPHPKMWSQRPAPWFRRCAQ